MSLLLLRALRVGLSTHTLGACLLSLVMVQPLAHAAESAATTPLTLQQAVSAALQSNPQLQSITFEFRMVDARAQQAALRPVPEVSIDLENFAGSGETKRLQAAEATFALSQVIELGGKRDARVGVAQAGRSALDIERQATQLDVLAEVARRFIAVAQRQQEVQLARTAVELADKTVSASERRVNAAKSPHAELDRAHIARDRYRLEERAVQVELDSARKQLAATWGASQPVIDGQVFGEVQADLFTLPPIGDFAELATRLAANPDFLRFASEARLRDAELRLAVSQRRPDVTLGAGLRRLEASKDQAFVASFSMPLFSGRRAEGFVAEAQANRELVDAERRIAEVKAQATLYELHRQLTRAVLEAQTLKDDIQPRIAEALKETEYAYERGRYSYLELVDAQREYLAVQATLIEAASSAHTLRAEIERLTNAPLTMSTP
ncbi:MAG: TolC family protein [Gammaproteobacteria bacterium]|nr:TolC family protein [Nitrosomonas nitrosa]MCC6206587.1 TolC family protein [Gammaproteobacteria bacterium]